MRSFERGQKCVFGSTQCVLELTWNKKIEKLILKGITKESSKKINYPNDNGKSPSKGVFAGSKAFCDNSE
jgi:hypothetical protein